MLSWLIEKILRNRKVEAAIGNIVMRALELGMTRRYQVEDGKTEAGAVKSLEIEGHVLDLTLRYMADIEGRLVGIQADINKCTNRSLQTREMVSAMLIESRGFKALPVEDFEPVVLLPTQTEVKERNNGAE